MSNLIDVQKVFQCPSPGIVLNFYVLDIQESKYGQIYFGYFSTSFYRTFAHFTQQQITALKEDFEFQFYDLKAGQSLEMIIGHDFTETKYFHKTKEAALNEGYFLNLAYIYLFYKAKRNLDKHIAYVQEVFAKAVVDGELEQADSDNFLAENMIKWLDHGGMVSVNTTMNALKQYPLLEYCASDSHVLIMNKPLARSYKQSQDFLDVSKSTNPELLKSKNIKELVEKLTSNGEYNTGFKKELSAYIHDNIFEFSESFYALNAKMINQISMLFELGHFEHFSDLKTIISIMKERKKFFHECCFYYDSSIPKAFKKAIKFLMKDMSLEKAIRMYNIDPSYIEDMAKDLDTVDYELDCSKHKDAKYLFTHISKRAVENLPNFKLSNNNEDYNEDLKALTSFSYNGYSLELIEDFKTLFNMGMLLSNCAGSNYTLEHYRDSITYVLRKDGEVKFMGGIKNNEFCQLKGFKNEMPERDLFVAMYDFLESHNYIKTKNLHKIKKYTYKKTDSKDLEELIYVQECYQFDRDEDSIKS